MPEINVHLRTTNRICRIGLGYVRKTLTENTRSFLPWTRVCVSYFYQKASCCGVFYVRGQGAFLRLPEISEKYEKSRFFGDGSADTLRPRPCGVLRKTGEGTLSLNGGILKHTGGTIIEAARERCGAVGPYPNSKRRRSGDFPDGGRNFVRRAFRRRRVTDCLRCLGRIMAEEK